MKQDNYYKPKVEAVATMSLAVEHFGNYLLEEIRKIS